MARPTWQFIHAVVVALGVFREYESERVVNREEAARVLSGVVDGLHAGAIRVGEGDDAVTVDAPEELTLEVEFEAEDDELSLELEMEWPVPESENAVAPAEVAPEEAPTRDTADTEESGPDTEDPAIPASAADASRSLARFEVYQDKADEWRWRLRHRNGNIIATGGEGYTRKHNALGGLRSVVENAPDAELTEESGG